VKPLRTERLLMRQWVAADREPFAALNADPVVMEHFPGPMSREASDAFVDRIEVQWNSNGWGLWAIEVPDVAPFIGYVGLWPADYLPHGPRVEVGWRLARHYWGHGYATEAASRAVAVGFEEVGLDEIVSFTVPQNRRSRAVMERIGLTEDPAASFDHPRVDAARNPHLVRHVFYRLSRQEWLANEAQARELQKAQA
jgi:RimJ/RimL family protein N-acetyltransferase